MESDLDDEEGPIYPVDSYTRCPSNDRGEFSGEGCDLYIGCKYSRVNHGGCGCCYIHCLCS